jgi:predicted nucleic acid-binding protein
MIQSYLLDTSYVIALEASDDQYHSRASTHWPNVTKTPFQLITTSYIFTEIVTYFNSRHRHSKAIEIGKRLLTSQQVEMVAVNSQLFEQGWQLFQRYDDKSYSLTDCISFEVMRQLNLTIALTFDHHFTQAGFLRLP